MFCHKAQTCAILCFFCLTVVAVVGQSSPTASNSAIPTLVNFSGVLTDAEGKPLTSIIGVTFSLYAESDGGAPLWVETQNVQPSRTGRYSVALGSTSAQGLPSGVFASGEARWLSVQARGLAEQPRVMLLAVPYALEARDAQTVGGLPASAFVLAQPGSAPNATSADSGARESNAGAPPAGAVTGSGTVNFVPLWTGASSIGNSALFQLGTGATAKIGVNTTTPVTPLDVKGGATVRGNLSLPTTGTATATAGKNSQTVTFTSSVFNSSSTTPVSQNFRWQSEPVGNNTTTASGSLNLLFAQGTGTMAETGLKLGHNGLITFAAGQTFPGTGKGTVTAVTAGTDLTGGGTSGSVTLNLDTALDVRLVSKGCVHRSGQCLAAVNHHHQALGVVVRHLRHLLG